MLRPRPPARLLLTTTARCLDMYAQGAPGGKSSSSSTCLPGRQCSTHIQTPVHAWLAAAVDIHRMLQQAGAASQKAKRACRDQSSAFAVFAVRHRRVQQSLLTAFAT